MVDHEGEPSAQAKGGKARARALPAKRRSEIAKGAAEVRWAKQKNDGELLLATHNGELRVGSVVLRCSVLEDGTRVLSQNTFVRAIGRRGNLKVTREAADYFQPPEFLAAENLKPFLPNDLEITSKPILYLGKGGRGRSGVNIGYRAELLPVVCQVFQDARDANALHATQHGMADACKVLFRAFATVGIVALVDEATGYQDVRARQALQAILDKFLRKELAAWAKVFPDEFYKQLFRLRKWEWASVSGRRPAHVGKLTKNLVYERLAPELIKELEERNPRLPSGRRAAKHHQWFTDDIGHPALAQHLHALVVLMRSFDTWEEFKETVDRALPRRTRIDDLPLFS